MLHLGNETTHHLHASFRQWGHISSSFSDHTTGLCDVYTLCLHIRIPHEDLHTLLGQSENTHHPDAMLRWGLGSITFCFVFIELLQSPQIPDKTRWRRQPSTYQQQQQTRCRRTSGPSQCWPPPSPAAAHENKATVNFTATPLHELKMQYLSDTTPCLPNCVSTHFMNNKWLRKKRNWGCYVQLS